MTSKNTPEQECTHKHTVVIKSGVIKCKKCGMSRPMPKEQECRYGGHYCLCEPNWCHTHEEIHTPLIDTGGQEQACPCICHQMVEQKGNCVNCKTNHDAFGFDMEVQINTLLVKYVRDSLGTKDVPMSNSTMRHATIDSIIELFNKVLASKREQIKKLPQIEINSVRAKGGFIHIKDVLEILQ